MAGGQRHYTGDRAALGRFEAFLFSAIATVGLVRAFLIVTGYPKVGGHGLHVAHVLWGGLLMGAAIAIVMVLIMLVVTFFYIREMVRVGEVQ